MITAIVIGWLVSVGATLWIIANVTGELCLIDLLISFLCGPLATIGWAIVHGGGIVIWRKK